MASFLQLVWNETVICAQFIVGTITSSLCSGSLMNSHQMKGFLFRNSASVLETRNTPSNLSVNTAKTQQFHPQNQPPFYKQRWLTRLIVTNSARQGFCWSGAAFILWWNPSNTVKSTQNSSWTQQQTVITSGCLCIYVTHRIKSRSASRRFLSHTHTHTHTHTHDLSSFFSTWSAAETIYFSFYFYH